MSRLAFLKTWLGEVLKLKHFQIEPISGDASFRRYFRVQTEHTHYIVMDAPPPENPGLFMEIAEILKTQGLSVPLIVAHNLKEGFLVLSDLGDRLYLNELTAETADRLYQDAIEALVQLQTIKAPVPIFDQPFLKNQLDLFYEWYLKNHLQLENINTIRETLDPLFDTIIEQVVKQPYVFVHRDFHSRNLMILENKNPGILDFQDAVLGPICYDLVSLFQDCYINWERTRVEDWVLQYLTLAKKKSLLSDNITLEQLLVWFDWTGLQRHLKNLGIFSRLHYRDGKSHYLKDIPMPLNYIRETCNRYPALESLAYFFESHNHKETSCAQ